MRILCTTIPAFTHTAALVPLAQAAQLAGHEVIFAGGGVTLKVAAEAGLPVLDAAPGQDVTAPYRRCMEIMAKEDLPGDQAQGVFVGATAEIGDMMLPGLVDAARGWGVDVVLYPPFLPWAQLAAHAAGAFGVMHGIGFRFPAVPWWATEPSEVVRRHGVTEFPAHPDAEVSLGVDSLERFNPRSPGEVPFPVFPVRPCSYNGSGQVPPWVLRRASRARIAVTMGNTSDDSSWAEVLRAIVEGTADLDAELALTSGGVDLSPIIGQLPERVRVVDFVPMSNLLPRCDALIHHAGMGTTYAALAAGVPQVALRPNKGDAPLNAHVMSSRGAGIAVDRSEATPEAIGKALREVLQVPSYRTASEEVAAEMAEMPTPQDVVGQLAEMAQSRTR
ncbi:nucleotide disphospho-sugar-binding domain-containing protein [Actinomadura sp. HBU206391]|uniref:nucleotide disphospho-sugar-binding domain-containing protein n=1 Tax=Actinomadura sp. HBU206391 TaxID=2731692 RepID=UPI00164FE127|nr:nucleotide disphospho-sugar-binding domain-containing protein [Actinomadura sp. HBU206391]MBC6456917.1 DUF1205 domain-containing protein [Actinomadura sp. HBU206391]